MTSQQSNFTIDAEQANRRLDLFLSRSMDGMTRSSALRHITNGLATVNSEKAKPSYKVKTGDIISVTLEEPIPAEALPEDIPLNVVYEDSSFVVIDKPANMVVHPAVGNYTGTLVNALLHHCTDLSGIGGVMRPGIVHRLDKGTSGIIVVAKSDEAHASLSAQFKARTVQKRYIALVYGKMEDSGMLDRDIGRDYKNRKKISSNSNSKKEAMTFYKVLKRYFRFCLVELTPKTGRTHQLRVHLSEAGHPIVGDELYGANRRLKSIQDTVLRKTIADLERFLLHAEYLSFDHPKSGERVEFFVPTPDNFAEILNVLESEAPKT